MKRAHSWGPWLPYPRLQQCIGRPCRVCGKRFEVDAFRMAGGPGSNRDLCTPCVRGQAAKAARKRHFARLRVMTHFGAMRGMIRRGDPVEAIAQRAILTAAIAVDEFGALLDDLDAVLEHAGSFLPAQRAELAAWRQELTTGPLRKHMARFLAREVTSWKHAGLVRGERTNGAAQPTTYSDPDSDSEDEELFVGRELTLVAG